MTKPKHLEPTRPEPSRWLEVLFLAARLGFTAFGGPAAHIAMLREQVVTRRGWQSDLARRMGVSRSTICRDFKLTDEAFRRGTSIETEEHYRRVIANFERQENRRMARIF